MTYFVFMLNFLLQDSSSFKTFGIPLEECELASFTISSGHIVSIPSFLVQAYSIISNNTNVEGIFRLTGNIQAQKQLTTRIENGGNFEVDDHIHDVVSLVKKFFREMPVVILGDKEMQDTLSKCLKTGIYASRCIRVALLMLPSLQLYMLVSFLQLLNRITKSRNQNKMDAYALAAVVAPNLTDDLGKTEMFIQITKILIEDADKVGMLPRKTLARYCLAKKKSRYLLLKSSIFLYLHRS